MGGSIAKKFFLLLVLFFILPYCSSSEKNKAIIGVSIDEANPFWLERGMDCSGEIPFCHREFWLKRNIQDVLPEELATLSKVWSANKIRGRLYVFTLLKYPAEELRVLPALPTGINQDRFKTWFSRNIFSSLLKNPMLRQRGSVLYRKDSWSIEDVQLLHTTCTLNIYPKVIEYPFVFVFLWEGLPSSFAYSYKKVEDWSIQQFKAILSPQTVFESEHNI